MLTGLRHFAGQGTGLAQEPQERRERLQACQHGEHRTHQGPCSAPTCLPQAAIHYLAQLAIQGSTLGLLPSSSPHLFTNSRTVMRSVSPECLLICSSSEELAWAMSCCRVLAGERLRRVLIACAACRAQWQRSMGASTPRPCRPLWTSWAFHAGML